MTGTIMLRGVAVQRSLCNNTSELILHENVIKTQSEISMKLIKHRVNKIHGLVYWAA